MAGGHGVSRSTDGGVTWYYMEDGLQNRNIRALALSPAYASDTTVFAGTACADASCKSPPTGSTDPPTVVSPGSPRRQGCHRKTSTPSLCHPRLPMIARCSWEHGAPGCGSRRTRAAAGSLLPRESRNLNVWSSALSPDFASDGTVFAGTERGLFRSTDAGATWYGLPDTLGARRISSIAVSPRYGVDRTLFVGSSNGGVFRSTDGGSHWAAFSSGMGHTYVQALALVDGARPYPLCRNCGGRGVAGRVGGRPVTQSTVGGRLESDLLAAQSCRSDSQPRPWPPFRASTSIVCHL